ncbi:DUF177 domain-containing protein [Lutibacter sp. HS1-25]|uniref:YceD family protein n=1 Tax=Lutibacter sp. HS1-25 TaxID=2485000 RepID=UPI0010138ABE|nr:DUF177 domain-containing protein [Lutibacter sp. HS1-25]RXP44485.1 DUF177 domain-containing protein [Lutibacter sp. HS1-25]
MKDLKDFDISFIGLKDGVHQFDYEIGQQFFDFFKYDEFYNSNVQVNLTFLKKPTMFELNFICNGWVEVDCDLTSERFQQPISANIDLIVKFGEQYNDENEELLIIPHSEYKINVAQFIYEAIVLNVPLKRVHPGIKDGTLQSEVLEKLKEFEIVSEEEIEEEEDTAREIDPRWNKLKEYTNSKK